MEAPGIFPQVGAALVVTLGIFLLFMVFETLYRAYLQYGSARISIYPKTGNRTVKFEQDPSSTSPTAKNLPLSENQLTGIEFSYSLFVYISDETIVDTPTTEGWKTLFYKGYESGPFPLLGPGVFVSDGSSRTEQPSLRVIMNTYDNWFNPIDVKQIPINKWFHLVLALRKNTLEVYVNGNLAAKRTFNGTLPYQNYQPLHLFPNVRTDSTWKSDANNEVKGIPVGDNFIVNGKATGYISNMNYFSYALSYSEIQGMMALGPSKEFDSTNMDLPPYLVDSWWTGRKNNTD